MASDFGLTTWALSPSASFNSTGRMAPKLERGATAGRPKPAARPASSASAGEEGTSTVRLGSCGSFMICSPCFEGLLNQDQASDQSCSARDLRSENTFV